MEFLSCIYECQNRGWKTSTGVKWGRQGFPKRVAVLFLPHVTLDRFQRRRQQCNFWRKKKTHAKLQNWGQQYNIYGAKIQKWTKSYLLVMFQSDFQALKMIQKFSPLVTQGLLQSLTCPFVALIYLTNATTDAWCKATFSRKTEHSCRPPFRVRPSVLHTRPKRHKTASFWKATFNNNFRAKSDFFYYFFFK